MHLLNALFELHKGHTYQRGGEKQFPFQSQDNHDTGIGITISGLPSRNVDLPDLSQRCSRFLLADLLFLFDQARLAAAHRARQDREELVALLDAEVLHAKVSGEDFADALKRVHAAMADEAGGSKIPQVKWDRRRWD